MRVDIIYPAEEIDQEVNFCRSQVLMRHLAERISQYQFRLRHHAANIVFSATVIDTGQVGSIITAKPQNGVAVIAVLLLKNPLPFHHVI